MNISICGFNATILFYTCDMEEDTQKENFLDELESAFYINVLSSDYWNSGTTLRNGESAFIDGKMKIT